jgi:hypothetical protein
VCEKAGLVTRPFSLYRHGNGFPKQPPSFKLFCLDPTLKAQPNVHFALDGCLQLGRRMTLLSAAKQTER